MEEIHRIGTTRAFQASSDACEVDILAHHNLYENQYGMDLPLFCCRIRQGARQL